MKKIVAVIPIRKGSQRVKDKNLRKFANTNLLRLKIDMLQKVEGLNDIIVNTDSEEAITIAKDAGVSYHKREMYYASSQCSGSDFFNHLGIVTDCDIFAYCPVTSPFIKKETINRCIETFLQFQDKFDSLSTVSLVKEFLWLEGCPLNYDVLNAPNSQNLPDIVALNFGFSLIKRDVLIANKNIIGKSPNFVQTSDIESIDIDTPLDFYIAEQIYIKTVLENKQLLD